MSRVPDVAIVGAGPVGMVAALELVGRGVDVTLLERRTAPRDSSRSIGLHPPALDVLERLGCTAVIEAGVRVREGEVRCDGTVLGELSFRSASPTHPYVLSIPQHVTERILRARLAELAPDALITACEVTGVQQGDAGVRLDTTRGPVRAKWVIGADGPRSTMRTLGGFVMRTRAYADRYVMADASDDAGLRELAVLYLESAGVVESFPLPCGRRRWVLHRGADAVPLSAPEFTDAVARRTGTDLDAEGLTSSSAFGIHHVWTDNAVRGRVVLAGDAAHEISPIGGQGMTLGWLDAAELAESLARALGGSASERLACYEAGALRRQRMAARQAFFNTAMGRPRHGVALAARNAAVRALTRPALERRVAAAFTMGAAAATVRSGRR